jgi:hypothetical protein
MGQITRGKLLLLLCFLVLSVQAVSISEIIAKLFNRLDPGTIASNAIDETLEISGQVRTPLLFSMKWRRSTVYLRCARLVSRVDYPSRCKVGFERHDL